MKHRLALIRTSLRILYGWLFSVLVSYFVLIIFMSEKPEMFIEAALLIIYLASYAVRNKSGYNIWIFAVHLILAVAVWLCPFSKSTCWVLSGIIVYLTGEAFLSEKKGSYADFSDVPWPTFFVSVIIYAYGYATKSRLLTTGAYIIPVMLMVVYLLIIYTDGLNRYVDSSKNISGLPIKKITSVNSSIVFIIVMLLLAGIYMGALLGLDAALYKAFRALLYLVSLVVFAIRLLLIFLTRPLTQTSDERLEYEQNKMSGFISEHSDDFTGMLDVVYKTGAALLVIWLLYKAAAWFIKFLMKKRTEEGDRIEEATVVNKNHSDFRRIKKEKHKLFSNEQKFRRLYRERILRHKYDIRLDSYKTSTDIQKELFDNEIDDISEITEAYESVRYGNKKPTKEMMKLFNK